jgi:hypothetical protein
MLPFKFSSPAMGSLYSPIQWVSGALSLELNRSGREAIC